MRASIASLLFVSAASALPTASYLSASTTFKLVANVVSNYTDSPAVQNYELTAEHSGACENYAVLVAPGEGGPFYANSTTVGVSPDLLESGSEIVPGGMIVTPGGTATVPSTNTVGLNCGYGTDGVSISSKGLLTYESGSWMACPPSVFHAGSTGDVLLSYKKAGQRTLAGCADVQMVAHCTNGTGGQNAQLVSCQ